MKKQPDARTKIDRDALHAYLYRKTDKKGQIRVVMHQLAEDLMVQRSTISRILGEMAEEGRCERLTRTSSRGGFMWQIHDPETWKERRRLKRAGLKT